MLEPNFYTQKVEVTPTYGKFILEPLPLSFGQSLGNALRRTLLSSLEGCVITNVKFEGVPHLFTTIEGVKESILEIVLNLKQIHFIYQGKGPFKVYLNASKPGKIYAKDLEGEVTPVDKNLYIAEITGSKAKIEMEAIAEVGVGSSLVEDREKKISGFIPVDAFFSPVKKVNFKVEEARVGRKSNYERLIIELETDGTISPEEALRNASLILANHFNHILSGKDVKKEEKPAQTEQDLIDQQYAEIIIDELNLPSRVVNALLKEKIETVADLIKAGREKLNQIKGLGRKSVEQIEQELKKLKLELK
jgi:DNA-directed RNA polymerase subunit alpha